MAKAKIVLDQEGRFYGIRFNCPGCAAAQNEDRPDTNPALGATTLPVRWLPPGVREESPYAKNSPHWDFNGDLENPVFGPSVLSRWEEYQGEEQPGKPVVCHSWIGINGAPPGHIIFLGDCTHSLKGKVMPLPEID